MIRLTTPDDVTDLIVLAEASGLFEPSQTEELVQILDQHFNGETENQDLWFTDDDNGVVGVAYLAPERMTEGTWNLYLIAIHPERQSKDAVLPYFVMLNKCWPVAVNVFYWWKRLVLRALNMFVHSTERAVTMRKLEFENSIRLEMTRLFSVKRW